VADGKNFEDTSLDGQFECMAADLRPWKDALLFGHHSLESYLLSMISRSINGPFGAYQWCNSSAIEQGLTVLLAQERWR